MARDEALGQWIAPFVMAPYNTRIVRRSNALQDWAYGRGFRYREVTGLGTGKLAPVDGRRAGRRPRWRVAGGLAVKPTRMLLDRVLPDPGEGPSEKAREAGLFRMEIHTTTSTGARYVSRVAAKGDPGYKATAVMMGESALCLALDRERLPRARRRADPGHRHRHAAGRPPARGRHDARGRARLAQCRARSPCCAASTSARATASACRSCASC